MSNGKRLILEIVVAALLVLICIAIWNTAQRRTERQLGESEARQKIAVSEAQEECRARAERLAASEATAVFRAFAAGIQGAALGRQTGMLDMAKGSLLRLPHVAFVHVLAPDGQILASSNEKYGVAGRADSRASWALQASDLQTRPGDLPGTVEIAAPFQGASGDAAVLWMGYKTRDLLAAAAQESRGGG